MVKKPKSKIETNPISPNTFTPAFKEIMLSPPKTKAKYKNKKPTKEEKNMKWRLVKRDTGN